jgi:hypothetical protein
MSDGYTIKEYIQEMDKRHTTRLDAIYDEVKKTNGRVRELEKWRSYLTGAVALAVALGIPNLIAVATAV